MLFSFVLSFWFCFVQYPTRIIPASTQRLTWRQVVTASGEIVRAGRNDSETSDLWDALRGGSTNFGIVTAVEITCFAHPEFFRGTNVLYLPIARQATLKALVEVGCAPFPADGQPVSHAMWCITQFYGMKFINALLTTTGSPKKVRMDGFTSVWGRISLTGRLGTSSHGKFIEEQGKLAPKNGSR
jgi:FAD/FMN-containing dehydrogenase